MSSFPSAVSCARERSTRRWFRANVSHRPSTSPGAPFRRALLIAMFGYMFFTIGVAADVRVVFANDFLASNRLSDDLYTGAFIIDYPIGRYVLTGGENLFTDSDNNLRFDETFVHLGRSLAPRGSWLPRVEAGLVHVGRGLLGERAQNAFHRAIGDDEVSLDYVEGSRLHASIRVVAERALPVLRPTNFRFEADVAAAIGFKEHAMARVRAEVPITRALRVDLSLGARYSHTSFDALRPRLATWGPTWEAGLTIRDRISLGWNYNNFGTKSQHFNISYVAKLGRKSRGQDNVEPQFERRRRDETLRAETTRDFVATAPRIGSARVPVSAGDLRAD